MIIKGAKVFDPASGIDGVNLDIETEEGRIKRLAPSISPDGQKVIDGRNLYAVPGLVDIHAHLREPGYESKETVMSGTQAAAKGGITTVVAMPNTNPPMDNIEMLRRLNGIVESDAAVEVLAASCMTQGRKGRIPVNFAEHKKHGYVLFTDDGSPVPDTAIMAAICRQAAAAKALLMEHPEVPFLTEDAPLSYGELADRTGLKGQPAESESIDIFTFGSLAGLYKARIHFTHVSTRASVETVRLLKSLYGGLITADATPHHLILSEKDNTALDPDKKMNPPLRPESDRLALEEALVDGTIDCIVTDHAPHTGTEKAAGFVKAPFGSAGFETLLASTFTRLVLTEKMSVSKWLNKVAVVPSRILGIPRGTLAAGAKANVTLFDPNSAFVVSKDSFASQSKNTAFAGMEFRGKVCFTVCGGRVVYES